MNQSKDVRNIQKKFKINKAEEILLTQRINKSGLTASEYIRQSVLHDNPVDVIDKANIIIPQLAGGSHGKARCIKINKDIIISHVLTAVAVTWLIYPPNNQCIHFIYNNFGKRLYDHILSARLFLPFR